eukprot:6407365-Lingulodinium_polyedra.AAC.1
MAACIAAATEGRDRALARCHVLRSEVEAMEKCLQVKREAHLAACREQAQAGLDDLIEQQRLEHAQAI